MLPEGAAPSFTTPKENAASNEEDIAELREKLRIVRTVLEQASFNGINRKVQIKPTRWKTVQVGKCVCMCCVCVLQASVMYKALHVCCGECQFEAIIL